VQVDPIIPISKAPGTKRLILKYDELPSNFALKFNLRRYIEALRVYLEGMLGEDKFIRAYKAMDDLHEQAGTY